jgi:hypothetical protein
MGLPGGLSIIGLWDLDPLEPLRKDIAGSSEFYSFGNLHLRVLCAHEMERDCEASAKVFRYLYRNIVL